MKFFYLTPLLLCAACAQPALESICPAVIPYSLAQQNGLSTELTQHPELKYIPLFLKGYAQTRDELRSLAAEQENVKDSTPRRR